MESKPPFILIIVIIITVILFSRAGFCAGLKNPFAPPFRIKQYGIGTINPLIGINLEGLIVASDSQKNVAIINNKPYYTGSKIMGKTIVNITGKAVYIKLKNSKILKLSLAKIEGFK